MAEAAKRRRPERLFLGKTMVLVRQVLANRSVQAECSHERHPEETFAGQGDLADEKRQVGGESLQDGSVLDCDRKLWCR
jgi:hypothetical protein